MLVHISNKSTGVSEGKVCTLGQKMLELMENSQATKSALRPPRYQEKRRYMFEIRLNAYHQGIHNKTGQVIYVSSKRI